jgi:uncharacterized membrane-anchored protein
MTGPLGASFADWSGKLLHKGGLGFGTIRVAITLMILIAVFVGYRTVTRIDVARAVDSLRKA